jgi:hypothetical protein
MKTDEDDEFDRIQRECEMKAGQPYLYPKLEGITLTDRELLSAYGWRDFEVNTLLQESYKNKILSGLRSVEMEVLKKNKLST